MFIIGKAPDFDVTSVEPSLAKNTEALIIERIPAPELVLGTQNRESIVEFEMSDHVQRAVCSLHRSAQSGQRMIA
jgi:hypothetical protein